MPRRKRRKSHAATSEKDGQVKKIKVVVAEKDLHGRKRKTENEEIVKERREKRTKKEKKVDLSHIFISTVPCCACAREIASQIRAETLKVRSLVYFDSSFNDSKGFEKAVSKCPSLGAEDTGCKTLASVYVEFERKNARKVTRSPFIHS